MKKFVRGFLLCSLGLLYADSYQEAELAYQKKSITQSVMLFQQSCEAGRSKGCSRVGDIYYFGKGVPKDLVQARNYYQFACNLNDHVSCMMIGDIYYHGEGVQKDFSLAKVYYEKACNLGCGSTCETYKEMEKEGY